MSSALPPPLTAAVISKNLADLDVFYFEFNDFSDYHKGHSGNAAGKGHYELTVVSDALRGKSRLERHRLIYQKMGELWQTQIHALNLNLYTIAEWQERQTAQGVIRGGK